jgi:hypothetical protein
LVKLAAILGLFHFCVFSVGDFILIIELHASKISVDASAQWQDFGCAARWRLLANFFAAAGHERMVEGAGRVN